MTLSKFSGRDAKCPKCGGTMGVRYQPPGFEFVKVGIVRQVGDSDDYPEWLYRECSDCFYAWPEQCKDA